MFAWARSLGARVIHVGDSVAPQYCVAVISLNTYFACVNSILDLTNTSSPNLLWEGSGPLIRRDSVSLRGFPPLLACSAPACLAPTFQGSVHAVAPTSAAFCRLDHQFADAGRRPAIGTG